jgi:hypothetical protein
LVLRLNQETRTPRLHVHGADRTRRHPTSRSPDHRVPDLCDHPQSSTSGLLLLPRSSSLLVKPHLPPAHHKTSKHDSPNETKIKEKQNYTGFEFKPRQVNNSPQSNQETDHLVSQSHEGRNMQDSRGSQVVRPVKSPLIERHKGHHISFRGRGEHRVLRHLTSLELHRHHKPMLHMFL